MLLDLLVKLKNLIRRVGAGLCLYCNILSTLRCKNARLQKFLLLCKNGNVLKCTI